MLSSSSVYAVFTSKILTKSGPTNNCSIVLSKKNRGTSCLGDQGTLVKAAEMHDRSSSVNLEVNDGLPLWLKLRQTLFGLQTWRRCFNRGRHGISIAVMLQQISLCRSVCSQTMGDLLTMKVRPFP